MKGESERGVGGLMRRLRCLATGHALRQYV